MEPEDTRVCDPPLAAMIEISSCAEGGTAKLEPIWDELLWSERDLGVGDGSEEPPCAVELDVGGTAVAAGAQSGAAFSHAVPPLARGVRCLWRLWRSLVALSVTESLLLTGAVVLEQLWSPCREPLAECLGLHPDDCAGASCLDAAPLWAPLWPPAGLLCLALPLCLVLRGRAGGDPRVILAILLVALAVVGMGATVLTMFSTTGFQYVTRCPMPRADGRCAADICPSPPCRRESELSPCVCGRVGEAEMARALFLKGFAACQPYEWYTEQMAALEDLVLRYEGFACIVAPLTCVSIAVGGMLVLAQLLCCPLLFLGSCGLDSTLLVLFASDEELDQLVEGDASGSKGNRRPELVQQAGSGPTAGRPALARAPTAALVQ